MAKLSIYNEQTMEAIPSASIIVLDSWKQRVGGLAANKEGEADIPDSYLLSSNSIEITSVGYEKMTIPVSKFNGNAFLKPSVKTQQEVIIKVKKKKPVKIINPFEEVTKNGREPSIPKKKAKWVVVLAAGLIVGTGIYLLINKK